MRRNFLYVYERIYKEMNVMEGEFKKLDINGRKTPAADLKRIAKIISDASYRVAQECQVLMNFPKWHIEGKKVVLGQEHIILPDCRIVDIEYLKDIEHSRKR